MKEQRDHFLAMQFEAQHAHYMRHYGKAAFWLIERSKEPVGRLYLDEWENELRLIDIALMPEHRGRGLGGAMLADVMSAAVSRGKAVRAHVEKSNPAQHLYARLGYRVIEDKQVYDLLEWYSKAGAEQPDGMPPGAVGLALGARKVAVGRGLSAVFGPQMVSGPRKILR
ncbi:GNAT family N-acetyltransferase [Breoghania sp.]|uniref:GNAT family N-acetyltransferase n=1 Tax=Breoghania sp. TaxID=2065378 RepID=UPI0026098836|nr:GNAT family N-acetyltransferase [Breoghania sp.]MDJ0929597.1 GNAT family N-acetyltransferase [Breoghania sp.]